MKNLKKKLTIVTAIGALVVCIGGANVLASSNDNVEANNADCTKQCVYDNIGHTNDVLSAVNKKAQTNAKAIKKTAEEKAAVATTSTDVAEDVADTTEPVKTTPAASTNINGNGNGNCDGTNCTPDSNCGGTGVPKHDGSGNANGNGNHYGNGEHNGNNQHRGNGNCINN